MARAGTGVTGVQRDTGSLEQGLSRGSDAARSARLCVRTRRLLVGICLGAAASWQGAG